MTELYTGKIPTPYKAVDYSNAGIKGLEYVKPDCITFRVVEVCPELVGRPWNQEALHQLHSVRPSKIVVSQGEVYANCCTWRVTVFVTPEVIIEKVVQEVEVGSTPLQVKEQFEAGIFYVPLHNLLLL